MEVGYGQIGNPESLVRSSGLGKSIVGSLSLSVSWYSNLQSAISKLPSGVRSFPSLHRETFLGHARRVGDEVERAAGHRG